MSGDSRIAILGWGSLLWEPHDAFDKWHDKWLCDGPQIKLEFSRISTSRLGALTLVIDENNGNAVTVSYCISKRKKVDETVADLRCREGTTLENIGFVDLIENRHRARLKVVQEQVSAWLNHQKLDAVVWTDLKSNFHEKCGSKFSTDAAIEHLKALQPDAKVKAAEYIWRARSFVQTPLRKKVQVPPWF